MFRMLHFMPFIVPMMHACCVCSILFLNFKFYFNFRREENSDLHAMIICTFFHSLIFTFELLLCLTISGLAILPYRVIFSPIFCMSTLSIAGCVWGFRHDRSLEVCIEEFKLAYN